MILHVRLTLPVLFAFMGLFLAWSAKAEPTCLEVFANPYALAEVPLEEPKNLYRFDWPSRPSRPALVIQAGLNSPRGSAERKARSTAWELLSRSEMLLGAEYVQQPIYGLYVDAYQDLFSGRGEKPLDLEASRRRRQLMDAFNKHFQGAAIPLSAEDLQKTATEIAQRIIENAKNSWAGIDRMSGAEFITKSRSQVMREQVQKRPDQVEEQLRQVLSYLIPRIYPHMGLLEAGYKEAHRVQFIQYGLQRIPGGDSNRPGQLDQFIRAVRNFGGPIFVLMGVMGGTHPVDALSFGVATSVGAQFLESLLQPIRWTQYFQSRWTMARLRWSSRRVSNIQTPGVQTGIFFDQLGQIEQLRQQLIEIDASDVEYEQQRYRVQKLVVKMNEMRNLAGQYMDHLKPVFAEATASFKEFDRLYAKIKRAKSIEEKKDLVFRLRRWTTELNQLNQWLSDLVSFVQPYGIALQDINKALADQLAVQQSSSDESGSGRALISLSNAIQLNVAGDQNYMDFLDRLQSQILTFQLAVQEKEALLNDVHFGGDRW